MKRTFFSLFIILALVLSVVATASAQGGVDRSALAVPTSLEELKLETALVGVEGVQPATLGLDRSLLGAAGPQEVIVTLKLDSVLQRAVDGAGRIDQRSQLRQIKAQQSAFLRQARTLAKDIKVFGAVQRVANAVLVKVDGSVLKDLAANPLVLSIKPVPVYEYAPITPDLATAVPQILSGFTQAELGVDGTGVSVGIIDGGVDYTHALLGGSGLVADYDSNDPSVIEAGTFPTAKVVGGYDFVGPTWPNTDLLPDPDPLDKPTYSGHGTHVASIAAGLTGVAPGASVYGLKVCSSVANSCSGYAMLQAMDWSTDPNGDGDTSDHLDVVNMSIGSSYGQPWDDDTSKAVELTSLAGVLVVTSAGNSGDLPYASGTPGATLSSLSSAATNNPADTIQLIEVVDPTGKPDMGAIWQNWSAPLASIVEAPVQYGDGAGGQLLGCSLGGNVNSAAPGTEPFPAGSLTGKIVLVNRGTCNFSIKIFNIQRGGGIAGIIGLVDASAPFVGSFGAGGPFTMPGFMISKADADLIRNGTYKSLRLDPANTENLGGTIASFSSRGPGQFPFTFTDGDTSTVFIKPEISAPGVITAADSGSGAGVVTMQGTSMASPMVAGSAALIKAGRPDLSGREVKALLVNYADPHVLSNAPVFGGTIVPVTRQGGGEVRVDKALDGPVAAWETQTRAPSVSFGFEEAASPNDFMLEIRNITLKNYTGIDITYKVTPTFLNADDAATLAVAFEFPDCNEHCEIVVPAYSTIQIPVRMVYMPTRVHDWINNSGSKGNSSAYLTKNEYDGYINFDNVATAEDDDAMLHLAWHFLPRKAGDVVADPATVVLDDEPEYGLPQGSTLLSNSAAGPAFIDVFSLVGESPDLPDGAWGMQSPIVDLKYFGVQTFSVPAGYCSDDESFVMVFNITSWERAAHADFPAEFDTYLDTDQDGTADFVVFNYDYGLLTTGTISGQNVTAVADLAAGTSSVFFYTGHSTHSANYQLTFCGEQIGMNASNFYQMMDSSVYAFDDYFTGNLTDAIEGMTFAPMGERYGGIITEYGAGEIPGGLWSHDTLTVIDWGAAGTNPGELGLLLSTTGVRGGVTSGAPGVREALKITVVEP